MRTAVFLSTVSSRSSPDWRLPASAGDAGPGAGPSSASPAPTRDDRPRHGLASGAAEKFMGQLPGVVDIEVGYARRRQRPRQLPGRAGPRSARSARGRPRPRKPQRVAKVTFDPDQVGLEAVLARFWEIHDPTQVDRPGPRRRQQLPPRDLPRTTRRQLRVARRFARPSTRQALAEAGVRHHRHRDRAAARVSPCRGVPPGLWKKHPVGECGLRPTGVRYPRRKSVPERGEVTTCNVPASSTPPTCTSTAAPTARRLRRPRAGRGAAGATRRAFETSSRSRWTSGSISSCSRATSTDGDWKDFQHRPVLHPADGAAPRGRHSGLPDRRQPRRRLGADAAPEPAAQRAGLLDAHCRDEGGPGVPAVVHGRGFPNRAVAENLVPDYPARWSTPSTSSAAHQPHRHAGSTTPTRPARCATSCRRATTTGRWATSTCRRSSPSGLGGVRRQHAGPTHPRDGAARLPPRSPSTPRSTWSRASTGPLDVVRWSLVTVDVGASRMSRPRSQ